MVERDLAKVEVAGSKPVSRSSFSPPGAPQVPPRPGACAAGGGRRFESGDPTAVTRRSKFEPDGGRPPSLVELGARSSANSFAPAPSASAKSGGRPPKGSRCWASYRSSSPARWSSCARRISRSASTQQRGVRSGKPRDSNRPSTACRPGDRHRRLGGRSRPPMRRTGRHTWLIEPLTAGEIHLACL